MSCFSIFSFCGDICHVMSIFLLLRRLRTAGNAQGISLRTQELYLLVFVARYADLFPTFLRLYRGGKPPLLAMYIIVLKILYISSTIGIVYAIRWKEPICSTYDKALDTFRHVEFAIVPCFVLATFAHLICGCGNGLDMLGNVQVLLWEFSVCLEAVAILPQLSLLRKYKSIENLTANYVFFGGAYALFYGISWIYKAYYEQGYQHNYLMEVCGCIQVILYAKFYYQWAVSKMNGRALTYGEGGDECYGCDVKELRYVKSSPLIDNSGIRKRGRSRVSAEDDQYRYHLLVV